MSIRHVSIASILLFQLGMGEAAYAWPKPPKVPSLPSVKDVVKTPANPIKDIQEQVVTHKNANDDDQRSTLAKAAQLAKNGYTTLPNPDHVRNMQEFHTKLDAAKKLGDEAHALYKSVSNPALDIYNAKANLEQFDKTYAAVSAIIPVFETGLPILTLHDRNQPVLADELKAFDKAVSTYLKHPDVYESWANSWKTRLQNAKDNNAKLAKTRKLVSAQEALKRDPQAVKAAIEQANKAFNAIKTSFAEGGSPSETHWNDFEQAVQAGINVSDDSFALY